MDNERGKVKIMRKQIEKLTFEEAKAVLENNDTLDRQVFDYMMNDANFWLEDILSGCDEDYCIDSCGYSYFRIKDRDSFREWVESNKEVVFMTGTEEEKVQKYFAKIDEWYTEADYDKQDELEEEVENMEEDIEDIICKSLKRFYEGAFKIDERTDYFLSMMDIFIEDIDNTFIDEEYNVKQFVPKHIIPQRVVQAKTIELF